jgi:hypothetical protein
VRDLSVWLNRCKPATFLAGFLGVVLALGVALGLVMYLVFLLFLSVLGDWGSG